MLTHYPVVLHHFDQSPFSEKIRVILGFKGIAWNSVLISRIMPRPLLMPLTGGYRRTPVMQIGADIYCDTQIIARELEARFPTPTLFPEGNAGVPWALGMWTDRSFFQNTVNLVFGTLDDRGRLRGAKFDVKAMKAAIPQMRDQFRAHIGWIEVQLGDGREWLLGKFSLADVNAYMNLWYTRANLSQRTKPLPAWVKSWPRALAPRPGKTASFASDMAPGPNCRPRALWRSLHKPPPKPRSSPILMTPTADDPETK